MGVPSQPFIVILCSPILCTQLIPQRLLQWHQPQQQHLMVCLIGMPDLCVSIYHWIHSRMQFGCLHTHTLTHANYKAWVWLLLMISLLVINYSNTFKWLSFNHKLKRFNRRSEISIMGPICIVYHSNRYKFTLPYLSILFPDHAGHHDNTKEPTNQNSAASPQIMRGKEITFFTIPWNLMYIIQL